MSTTDLYPTPEAAAPMLAALDYRVIPTRAGTKVPALKDWPNVATTDGATIAGWSWDGGVCVVTGEASNLVVLDVDVKDGAPGAETLKALIDEHGKLPVTPVSDTPSGGLHYYFRFPKGHKIRNDAGRKLGPGLDIRADGGQVVAPPTSRPAGSYKWHAGRAVWDVDPADMPAWMVDRIAEKPPAPSQAEVKRFRTDRAHETPWVDEFNRAHTWAELLNGDGWSLAHTNRDGAEQWCRPGKDGREGASATVNHAGLDCLYVFTTSLPWLPSDRMYDKYGYMVHRDYGGDFRAAGRALGTQPRAKVANPVTGEIMGPITSSSSGVILSTTQTVVDAWHAPQRIHLPDEFWAARSVFQQIRQAAHSRTVSADALLHCVLCRTAGAMPHTLKLPPIVGGPVSLAYFSTLIGRAGSGKSGAHAAAAEYVPVGDYVADGLPVGSGEGLAEAFFDVVSEINGDTGKAEKVKRQVRHNAIVYIDEGEAVTALGARNGSTTLAAYRSAWTGQLIGQSNASNERKRILNAGTYTIGIILALQPELAGALLADETAGTPQRFAWAWSTDPSIPDIRSEWPGAIELKIPPTIWGGQYMAVDPAIDAEIRAQHLAVARGEIQLEAGEGHAMLLRLKMAALFAVLDERLNVDSEDWRLAGIAADTSRAVRNHVAAIVAAVRHETEKAISARLASRQVEATTAVERNFVDGVRQKVVEIVQGHATEGIAPGALTRALSRRQREVFQEAAALAVERGEICLHVEPGLKTESRRYWPSEAQR